MGCVSVRITRRPREHRHALTASTSPQSLCLRPPWFPAAGACSRTSPLPATQLQAREPRPAQLRRALRALPAKERAIVLLRRWSRSCPWAVAEHSAQAAQAPALKRALLCCFRQRCGFGGRICRLRRRSRPNSAQQRGLRRAVALCGSSAGQIVGRVIQRLDVLVLRVGLVFDDRLFFRRRFRGPQIHIVPHAQVLEHLLRHFGKHRR